MCTCGTTRKTQKKIDLRKWMQIVRIRTISFKSINAFAILYMISDEKIHKKIFVSISTMLCQVL